MKILAVGGGSGGHITPAVAVVREILKQKDQINKVLLTKDSVEEKVKKLINKANNRGGTDNISVAYLVREAGEN